MKSKVILVLSFCLIGFLYFAQETVYIMQDNKKDRKINSNRTVEHINVVKYDPLQSIVGEVKFSFEHVISDKTSFEIGLGPTLDGITSIRFFDDFGSFNQEGRIGYVAELGYRFYPLDDNPALNRLYISPVAGYKLYNSNLNPDQNFYPNLSDKTSQSHRGYFTFNIGIQSWLAKQFSVDYYAGFGLAMLLNDNFFIDENFDPNTGNLDYKWENNISRNNVFQFKLGVKFGIGWTN